MKRDTSKPELNSETMNDLLCQALETELGGVEIYKNALKCVQNADLEEEWQEYLEQTENHVNVLTEVLEGLGIDPQTSTPGREVVKQLGKSLVAAMQKARSSANAGAAELVAAECVVLAETKDHMNWELMGKLAEHLPAKERELLSDAYEQVEDEEDEHLYHSIGWARELWLSALGLPAVLPPPEEEQDVTSAIEAAEAKEESEARR